MAPAVAVEGCSSEHLKGRSMCEVMRMAPAPLAHGIAVHKTYHAGERHVQQLAGVTQKADAVGAGHGRSHIPKCANFTNESV
jgi:hypothetical protein